MSIHSAGQDPEQPDLIEPAVEQEPAWIRWLSEIARCIDSVIYFFHSFN